ncbi:hypothetical protein GCM10020221_28240 [Streptomyces thioluteus]|uniref:Uncharacterized protein n=1 Tax=Streptomyces thioluteus TaxID=66431 RepID=A0ABP6JH52_STRTU
MALAPGELPEDVGAQGVEGDVTRSRPASRRAVAVRARPMPLVVRDIRGRGASAAQRSTMETSRAEQRFAAGEADPVMRAG